MEKNILECYLSEQRRNAELCRQNEILLRNCDYLSKRCQTLAPKALAYDKVSTQLNNAEAISQAYFRAHSDRLMECYNLQDRVKELEDKVTRLNGEASRLTVHCAKVKETLLRHLAGMGYLSQPGMDAFKRYLNGGPLA